MGAVKTRLAGSIGDERALGVYEMLRQHTANVTTGVQAVRVVAYSDFLPESDLFNPEKFSVRLQEGDDLGERMYRAIAGGFAEGFSQVVLIGTDCLELTTGVIEAAFDALDHGDAVIGPACDGGFYLIGLRRICRELFLNRVWSTATVYSESVALLVQSGMSYASLPELSDIDTVEDLQRSALWPLIP